MSPIMLIVLAPAVILWLGFVSLLLGSATAGAWEALEGLDEEAPSVEERAEPGPAASHRSYDRAA